MWAAVAKLLGLLRRLAARLLRRDARRRFRAAVEEGDLRLLARLHRRQPDLRFPVAGQANLLAYAARLGDVDVVRFLAERGGFAPDACNEHGDNALLSAAFAGSLPVLAYLLDELGADPRHSDYRGNGLLSVLCANGHHEAVQALLESCPRLDPNARNVQGQTCLHRAARHNRLPTVRVLLRLLSVELQPRDINGDTPLHLAATHFHLAVLRELAAAGGRELLCAPNNAGETPLSIAARHLDFYARRYMDADARLPEAEVERCVLEGEPPPAFALHLCRAKGRSSLP